MSEWTQIANGVIKDFMADYPARQAERNRAMRRLMGITPEEEAKWTDKWERERKAKAGEYREFIESLKVGDEVGTQWYSEPEIHKVVNVGKDFVTVQNGKRKMRYTSSLPIHDSDTLVKADADLRERIAKRQMLSAMGFRQNRDGYDDCYTDEPPDAFETATIPQLRKIAKILGVDL